MAAVIKPKLRWGLVILFIWGGLGFYQFRSLIYDEGWVKVSRQLQVLEVIGWVGLLLLFAFTVFAWMGRSENILSWIDKGVACLRRFRLLSLFSVFFLNLAYPFLVIGRYGVYLTDPFTRTSVYILFVLIIAVLLSAWHQKKYWMEMLPISLLSLAVIHNAAAYIPHVSAYPFSLGWSEGSRYYYSSIFFADRIYGQEVPWPHSNFSRYLMQSVPFIFPSLPLWVHRLWQAILRFVFPFLGGFILSRRMGLKSRLEAFLLALWAGLFFFQGPVFYQMMVIVILVVWLFDPTKLWRSLVVVGAASVWAGFTRINWVPMPGLIAATLYFMEAHVGGTDKKSIASYLLPPALWTITGGVIGLGTQTWYVNNSGLSPELLQGAFSQELLWYRLWPNLSYPLGILFAIGLVSGPFFAFILSSMSKRKQRWHPLRLLGLAAILLVLFLGGVVISVKIGGGTNLHNLDAYLTILLLIGVYIFFGRFVDLKGEGKSIRPEGFLLSLIVIIPAIFAVMFGGPLADLEFAMAEKTLSRLKSYVAEANKEDGEILFVSQRHLITFGLIEDVDLVHDYEQMILMEMAMAGNQVYLDLLREDLESHRFSLIVHGRLPRRLKDKAEFSLAEENNVYFERVASMMTCNYEIIEKLPGIDVLVPKDSRECD
jgi:hypothetical protein